ncbi:MAG: hypothetical protein ACYTX0_62530, partial [Nostoc sp.]
LLAEVKGANELTREAAIARIRKRWEILPIQWSSQVQEWKEQGSKGDNMYQSQAFSQDFLVVFNLLMMLNETN